MVPIGFDTSLTLIFAPSQGTTTETVRFIQSAVNWSAHAALRHIPRRLTLENLRALPSPDIAFNAWSRVLNSESLIWSPCSLQLLGLMDVLSAQLLSEYRIQSFSFYHVPLCLAIGSATIGSVPALCHPPFPVFLWKSGVFEDFLHLLHHSDSWSWWPKFPCGRCRTRQLWDMTTTSSGTRFNKGHERKILWHRFSWCNPLATTHSLVKKGWSALLIMFSHPMSLIIHADPAHI